VSTQNTLKGLEMNCKFIAIILFMPLLLLSNLAVAEKSVYFNCKFQHGDDKGVDWDISSFKIEGDEYVRVKRTDVGGNKYAIETIKISRVNGDVTRKVDTYWQDSGELMSGKFDILNTYHRGSCEKKTRELKF
jgi:hypothetical protein